MNRISGGIYGLLIGDAAGVPYEFKDPQALPLPFTLKDNLSIHDGMRTSWAGVPPGTWSDDGSLALALLDTIMVVVNGQDVFSIERFKQNIVAWKQTGKYAVDHEVFDIGIQTAYAISTIISGDELDVPPNREGNGSLMRTLPCAFFAESEQEAAELAEETSKVTHPNKFSLLCCGAYAVLAWHLMQGEDKSVAYGHMIAYLDRKDPKFLHPHRVSGSAPLSGSGYVVDSFWTAIECFMKSDNYRETITRAISYGNDTDTTAAIAGGLAGVYWGKEGIPECFMNALREKATVEAILK